MTQCPFHTPVTIPADGTPTRPAPAFAEWRKHDAAVPLLYQDGHEGLLITRYDEARAVLADPRFSQQPQRMPASHAKYVDRVDPGEVDDEIAEAGRVANILGSDGEAHLRLRRAITRRFSVRSARRHADRIGEIASEQLGHLRAAGSPADLTRIYAEPISARVHCLVLGIPDPLVARFARDYVHGAPKQQQHDLLREAIEHRRENPGEDVISDLLASDFTEAEVLGMVHTLSMSGRDTVAYFIVTGTIALLSDRSQFEALAADPDRIPAAVEEIVRYGTMFLTVFPRTAMQDVQLGDRLIPAGATVSVSPVSANRDEQHWGSDADRLDVDRDARGHLGFGDGPHMCVGQQVARVEVATALRTLITGMPSLEIVGADQLVPQALAHPVATYEAGSLVVHW